MAKVALLIGVSEYEPGLNPLPAAVRDIEAMQRVLQDPEMGHFDRVKTLANPDPQTMHYEIEILFSEASKDDLVLLFFSGHGIKDDAGNLHFATRKTRKNEKGNLIRSTAVSAYSVRETMNNSRARRQAIILDCCFSGAFEAALLAKDDGSIDLQTQLGAEGRVVLTSSSSTQYSFEQQGVDLSLYTRYLVEGIETGAGDCNSDGWVSMLELHEYASSKVQETAPNMTPKIIVVKDKGFEIYLAKARVADPKLKYRKKASEYADSGTIRPTRRAILDKLRQQLGLTVDEAAEIEAEVLRPFQERLINLQQYRETLLAEAEHEYPLSEIARQDLMTLQQMLGLRDEDILLIQQEVEAQFAGQASDDFARIKQPQLEETEFEYQEILRREAECQKQTEQQEQQRQAEAVIQQHLLEQQTAPDPSICNMTRKLNEGEIYVGRVTRIIPLGAFVEIMPGKEGMIHISQLAARRVYRVEDEVAVGDEVTVKVHEIDSRGRIKLTRLGIYPDEVAAVRKEVLGQEAEAECGQEADYQQNLHRYQQKLHQLSQSEFPLSESAIERLKRSQISYGIRDDDADFLLKQLEEQKGISGNTTPVENSNETSKVSDSKILSKAISQGTQRESQKKKYQPKTQSNNLKELIDEDNLLSAEGIDYDQLKSFLKSKNWKKADLVTQEIIIKLAQPIGLDDKGISKLSCIDLHTIDSLWVKYSNGHFGFSVQKFIYDQCNRNIKKWTETIGWRNKPGMFMGLFGVKNHEQLTFSLEAPSGHLPSGPGGLGQVGWNCWEKHFFVRLEKCGL